MTFFLTLVFMFLVFFRPQDWLFPVLFGKPILDILVAIALLALLLEISINRIRFPKKAPQLWLLLGLWIATLMSHIAHTYFAGLLNTLPETFKFCFLTFLLVVVLDSSKRLRTVARLFVLMACLMTVHALLQQHRGYGFAEQTPIYQWRPVQGAWVFRSLFFGIFEDPNDMAQFLAMSIPFGFVMFRQGGLKNSVWGCILTGFLISGILATGSRGGLIALAVTLTLMFASLLSPRRQPIFLLLLALGGLLLLPLAGALLDSSAHDRVIFWGDANFAFKTAPLFGVGFGRLDEYIEGSRAVHNAYVSCYASIGLIGYWCWFGLLFSGVLGLWRILSCLHHPSTTDEQWFRRFCNMSLAGFGGFMASSYFLSRAFVYPLFFLIAILAVIPLVWQRETDRPETLYYTTKELVVLNTVLSLSSIAYIYVSILILNSVWVK